MIRTLGSIGAVGIVGSAVTGSAGADARDPEPAAGTCGDRSVPPASRGESDDDVDDPPAGAERYVAVVDRIVDGEHVVLLLEQDGELVDQLVVSADEHDELEERDILIAVIKDDELLSYRIVPERPSDGP